MSDKRPKVFICYASQDLGKALEIYRYLSELGADPWIDKENLVHGDDWEAEIKKAVRDSDAVVVCLRPGFNEVGFRQQEVRWAIEALQLRPPDRGFIIPFIVEPCDLPHWCKQIHAGSNLTRPTTLEELRRAVEKHCRVALPFPSDDAIAPSSTLKPPDVKSHRRIVEPPPDSPLSFRKHEACLAIVKELNTRSNEGQARDPSIAWKEVLEIVRSSNSSAGDVERETKAAVQELETLELVVKRIDANSLWGWRSIGPTDDFFWKTDPLFQPWSPKDDALEVCRHAGSDDAIRVDEVDAKLGWGPRRMNSALAYLAAHDLINYFENFGGVRYVLHACFVNEEGHLFLEDNAST